MVEAICFTILHYSIVQLNCICTLIRSTDTSEYIQADTIQECYDMYATYSQLIRLTNKTIRNTVSSSCLSYKCKYKLMFWAWCDAWCSLYPNRSDDHRFIVSTSSKKIINKYTGNYIFQYRLYFTTNGDIILHHEQITFKLAKTAIVLVSLSPNSW